MLPTRVSDEPDLAPIGMQHVLFPYIFLICGLLISIAAFLIEIKLVTRRAKKTRSVTFAWQSKAAKGGTEDLAPEQQ